MKTHRQKTAPETVPNNRFIKITTSCCDKNGTARNSQTDTIDFDREIAAANLYVALESLIKSYNEKYQIRARLQELEDWLNAQKALYKTVKGSDFDTIEDTGLTIADIKTEYGSIDFFIEFGIFYPEE